MAGFFGRIGGYFDGSDPEPEPVAPPRALVPPQALIGAGLIVKGEVSGEGDLAIAGSFEGEIAVAGVVRVLEGGVVEANISAHAIVIGGTVRGNVSAGTRVEMLGTGTLMGTVRSGSLVASPGASLRGEVWISRESQPVLAGAAASA